MRSNRRLFNDFAVNTSEYAKDVIIYQSVTGRIYIRHDDILAENPDFTEADFMSWKEISDNDYLNIENGDHMESRNCYPYWYPGYEGKSIDSPEKEMIRREEMEDDFLSLRTAMEKLTPVQRRRVWLFYARKLTVKQIACIEKVSYEAVAKSIKAARESFQKLQN